MNKTELIKKVAVENELSQKDAAAVVNSVLNTVMDSLAAHFHAPCRVSFFDARCVDRQFDDRNLNSKECAGKRRALLPARFLV